MHFSGHLRENLPFYYEVVMTVRLDTNPFNVLSREATPFREGEQPIEEVSAKVEEPSAALSGRPTPSEKEGTPTRRYTRAQLLAARNDITEKMRLAAEEKMKPALMELLPYVDKGPGALIVADGLSERKARHICLVAQKVIAGAEGVGHDGESGVDGPS